LSICHLAKIRILPTLGDTLGPSVGKGPLGPHPRAVAPSARGLREVQRQPPSTSPPASTIASLTASRVQPWPTS